MLKTYEILVVFIFSMILRATLEIFFQYSSSELDTYYSDLFFQTLMYLSMGVVYYILIRDKRENYSILSTGLSKHTVFNDFYFAVVIAVLLFMFSLGENALEVIILSKANKTLAYSIFNFHPESINVVPIYSIKSIAYILVTTLIAPAMEEIVFRFLLLSSLAKKYGVIKGILFSSALFTLVHFSSPYYVSTFAFSIVLCIVFLVRRSVLLCMFIHGLYNFVAFIHQDYFDIQWTRTINEIDSYVYWGPQLVSLFVSSTAFLYFLYRYKNKIIDCVSNYKANLIAI